MVTNTVFHGKSTVDELLGPDGKFRNYNNSSLLIVTIKKDVDSIKNLENETTLFVRAIDHFGPSSQAANPQYADLEGWERLLKPFKPKQIMRDTKLYKFER